MRNVALPEQITAVAARLVTNTHTQTHTPHTHKDTRRAPPPLPPPPPETDRPSHRAPGGAKNVCAYRL